MVQQQLQLQQCHAILKVVLLQEACSCYTCDCTKLGLVFELCGMWRGVRAAGVLTAVLSQRRLTLADSSTATPLEQGAAANAAQLPHSAPYATHSPSVEGKKVQSSFGSNSSTALQNEQQPQPQLHKQPQKVYPPALQEGKHFAVFGADGASSRLDSIVAAMQQADVVILGEYHDDLVAHALKLELLKRTARALEYLVHFSHHGNTVNCSSCSSHMKQQVVQEAQHSIPVNLNQQQQQQGKESLPPVPHRPLLLSLEMFERDVQPVLDEYLAGTATFADLLRDARPWPNYKRDYHPLVEFCRSLAAVYNSKAGKAASTDATSSSTAGGTARNGISSDKSSSDNNSSVSSSSSSSSNTDNAGAMPYVKVVAANAPRRYVSLAGRSGRQALLDLPAASKAYLAPLPYAQPSAAYIDKVQTSMRRAAVEMQQHREREKQHKHHHQQQPQQSTASNMAEQHSDSRFQQQQTKSSAAGKSAEHYSTAGTHDFQVPTGTASSAGAAAGQVSGATEGACPYIGFTVSSNFIDAQCLWDSTMAYAIAEQLHTYRSSCTAAAAAATPPPAAAAAATVKGQGGQRTSVGSDVAAQTQQPPLIVHVCGKFHAESGLGVPEHLEVYAPGARILIVVFVPHNNMALSTQQFEDAGLKGQADFVVLTDGSLPRSFATVHPV